MLDVDAKRVPYKLGTKTGVEERIICGLLLRDWFHAASLTLIAYLLYVQRGGKVSFELCQWVGFRWGQFCLFMGILSEVPFGCLST